MHFQRDYEYPLYKRTNPEEMQIVPKGVFGNRQNFIFPQKLVVSQSTDYEPPRMVKPNTLGESSRALPASEYYYQKELHGWDKNCSCGILTSEYRNPVEYHQPVIPRSLNVRMTYPNQQHSSQNNICTGATNGLQCSRTSTDDFPLWLKIYSRASIECDHKLHWDMFNIRDLYFFDNVLVKLYELDLEEIILWYKCYKNALLREMDKRLLKANQQRQMILLYNS